MRYIGFRTFLLCFLFFMANSNAQEIQYRFSVGYGFANGYFPTRNDIEGVDYGTPSLGKEYGFAFDFLFSNGKSVGVGYALQSMTRTINDRELVIGNTGLEFDNYRLEYETQFYDIHYRKQFNSGIGLTVGVFYYRSFQGNLDVSSDGIENGERYFRFSDASARSDNFGLSPALDYMIRISDGVHIGLQGRIFYTLSGIEAFSITPKVFFEF